MFTIFRTRIDEPLKRFHFIVGIQLKKFRREKRLIADIFLSLNAEGRNYENDHSPRMCLFMC